MLNKHGIKAAYATAISLLLAFAPCVYAAGSAVLLPTSTGDIASSKLFKLSNIPIHNHSKDDVAVSWPVDKSTVEYDHQPPYVSESRAYWKVVSAEQLQDGVIVSATAPGAIVKISPKTATAAQKLDIGSIDIIDPRGVRSRLADRSARIATFKQLDKLKTVFPPGTLVFKLNDSLGSGEFRLMARTAMDVQDEFIVYVLDKNSDYVFTMQMQNELVLDDAIVAKLAMQAPDGLQAPGSVQAFLLGPRGQRLQMNTTAAGGNKIVATYPVTKPDDIDTGLWEAHAMIETIVGNVKTRRNVKNVVAINRAGAALNDTVHIDRDTTAPGALTLGFDLDIASAGRYEIRGTLYATDENGRLIPVMYANSAGWREIGGSRLNLVFDLAKLDKNYSAPYELRHLKLYDQGRMMLLRRQSRALVLN